MIDPTGKVHESVTAAAIAFNRVPGSVSQACILQRRGWRFATVVEAEAAGIRVYLPPSSR